MVILAAMAEKQFDTRTSWKRRAAVETEREQVEVQQSENGGYLRVWQHMFIISACPVASSFLNSSPWNYCLGIKPDRDFSPHCFLSVL